MQEMNYSSGKHKTLYLFYSCIPLQEAFEHSKDSEALSSKPYALQALTGFLGLEVCKLSHAGGAENQYVAAVTS